MVVSHRPSLTFHACGTTAVPPRRQGSSAQGQFPQDRQNSRVVHYSFQKSSSDIQLARGHLHKLMDKYRQVKETSHCPKPHCQEIPMFSLPV